jgi:hypothetical protein
MPRYQIELKLNNGKWLYAVLNSSDAQLFNKKFAGLKATNAQFVFITDKGKSINLRGGECKSIVLRVV